MTPQTVAVLSVMVDEAEQAHYGLAIARETGLKTGTLHPILARLQEAGWTTSAWEDPEDHEDQGRPRRRYHRLTEDGEQAARRAVAAANATGARAGLHPRTAQ
jgi:DNA-binding PadR family transcriptional regulator